MQDREDIKKEKERGRITVKSNCLTCLRIFALAAVISLSSDKVSAQPQTQVIEVDILTDLTEGSDIRVTFIFKDFDGNTSLPDVVRYRLDCEEPKRQLIDWTEVDEDDIAAETNVFLPASVQRIIKARPNYATELHTITAEISWTQDEVTYKSVGKATFRLIDMKNFP